MKAVVYQKPLPIDHPEALIDVERPAPTPGPMDLLVQIEAISVNPVDTKIRQFVTPSGSRILGWDAVGVVVDIGEEVEQFQPGQRVWYAGALDRPGTNSELHCVDARLAALAPTSLTPAAAAALPLTAITAWELLFKQLQIPRDDAPSDDVLLISGAAGGVGSILIQLAKQLTTATIIATAGRQESRDWVNTLGADHIIDYHEPLAPQLNALGIEAVTHVASLTHTEHYLDQFIELTAPFGHIALIDDPSSLNVMPMKRRSLSLHWEFMFTRSMFQTKDMSEQGALLTEVARLVDEGVLSTTLQQHLSPINAATLKKAHALIEQGGSRGKITLSNTSNENEE